MATARPLLQQRPRYVAKLSPADPDMTPVANQGNSGPFYSPIGKSWEENMRTSWFSAPEKDSLDIVRCPPPPSSSPSPSVGVPLSTVNAMGTAAVWEILPVLLAEQQQISASSSSSECSEPPEMIFDDQPTPSDDPFPEPMDFFAELDECLAALEDSEAAQFSPEIEQEEMEKYYTDYRHSTKHVSTDVESELNQMHKSVAFVRARRSTPEFERLCSNTEAPAAVLPPRTSMSSTMLPSLLCPPRSSSLPKDIDGNHFIFPIACSAMSAWQRSDWAPKRPAPSPPRSTPHSQERSFFDDDEFPVVNQRYRSGSLSSKRTLKKHEEDVSQRQGFSKTMKDVLRCRWMKRNHSI